MIRCSQGEDRLIVFEDFAQFFFQLPLGKHVLDAAPGSLAALAAAAAFGRRSGRSTMGSKS